MNAANFLLVDDDPIFLAVTESILMSLGDHQITVAVHGADGLKVLRAAPKPFDFIILDLNMPELDGLAFLRGAAELGFKGQIVISSGEDEAVLRSARLMGQLLGVKVLGAIKKPINAAKFVALLTQATTPESAAVRAAPNVPTIAAETLEIVPYYQAQHNAWDRSIKGLEALVRVRGSDGQIHGPGKLFGGIRTHTELVSITLEIAAKVLDDMKFWRADGIDCRVSINLDAKIAEDPTVGAALVSMTKERGVDPRMVCLELTETAMPKDITHLVEAMTRLRMAGFGLSLDDFGTGASNFEVLRLCPFTEIKMDGSIMRAAAAEPIARHFLESSVAMARELEIEVVGEGVETEAQLELARNFGVETIQGFLFSMPVPASDMRRPLYQQFQRQRMTRPLSAPASTR